MYQVDIRLANFRGTIHNPSTKEAKKNVGHVFKVSLSYVASVSQTDKQNKASLSWAGMGHVRSVFKINNIKKSQVCFACMLVI